MKLVVMEGSSRKVSFRYLYFFLPHRFLFLKRLYNFNHFCRNGDTENRPSAIN